MATIFKRNKGEVSFYSDKEVEPPKKDVESLTAIRHLFSDEEFEAKMDQINAQAEQGEEVEPNIDSLTRVSDRYEFLAPLARDTRNAQVAMAVALLNAKPKGTLEDHLKDVKKATKASWKNLRDWCDVPAEPGAGNKKSGKLRVETKTVRAIDDEIEKGKAAAAARRQKAAENKANASS